MLEGRWLFAVKVQDAQTGRVLVPRLFVVAIGPDEAQAAAVLWTAEHSPSDLPVTLRLGARRLLTGVVVAENEDEEEVE